MCPEGLSSGGSNGAGFLYSFWRMACLSFTRDSPSSDIFTLCRCHSGIKNAQHPPITARKKAPLPGRYQSSRVRPQLPRPGPRWLMPEPSYQTARGLLQPWFPPPPPRPLHEPLL